MSPLLPGATRTTTRRTEVVLTSETRREIRRLLGNRAVPDVAWLARVTGREAQSILPFIRETEVLLGMERSIHRGLARTGRTYYARFPAPLDLYVIARLLRPRVIIESGVSSGISSAHILAALRKNGRGKLHSIDLP
jgi:hypothetical protein